MSSANIAGIISPIGRRVVVAAVAVVVAVGVVAVVAVIVINFILIKNLEKQ